MNFAAFYAELQAIIPKAEAAFQAVEPVVAAAVSLVDPALGPGIAAAEAVATQVIKAVPEVTDAIAIAESLVSGLKAIARGETPAEWSAFVAQKNADDAAVLALQPSGN